MKCEKRNTSVVSSGKRFALVPMNMVPIILLRLQSMEELGQGKHRCGHL